jgi:uncharacterized protein (DUF1501 family)
MADLETHEILEILSTPADAVPGQVTRRRFIQGAIAAGGLAMMPSMFDGLAAAVSPVGANEGILVVLHLGGGNDGLNTIVPRTDSTYRTLRKSLAITNPLPLDATWGLHPALPKLKARFDAGKVAVVHGVGQSTTNDLSHFSSTASWMAGTAGPSRSTGWLGRWGDGLADGTDGMRIFTTGTSIPLHLQGQQAVVTALNPSGDLFGADRSEPWLTSGYDAVTAMAAASTGKGVWADRLATASARAVAQAVELDPLFTPAIEGNTLTSQLTLVARAINANLGIRVFNTSLGSFDTHDNQLYEHQVLLADLDQAIDTFYASLAPVWANRVTLMTFSEFGRRVEANGSNGTDHATSSAHLVIGDLVKGGFHGAAPRLDALDSRGNPTVSLDYRGYYGAILDGWLGGGSSTVIGGTWEQPTLFRSPPGTTTTTTTTTTVPVTTTTTPVPTTSPWYPFRRAPDLVRQQYLDFYARTGDSGGVNYWSTQLTSGRMTVAQVVDAFLHAPEFGRSIAPVARVALASLGTTPAFADLLAWGARIRAGETLAAVAATVATKPEFATRYGSLTVANFVTAAYRDLMGRAPTAAERTTWTTDLNAATKKRSDLIAALAATTAAEAKLRPQVEVLMTYAGLLRRRPDTGGWTYWVDRVTKGTSIQALVNLFFNSSEYRRRFIPG